MVTNQLVGSKAADRCDESSQVRELRIHLLGGFQLCLGGKVIHPERFRLRKARDLIKLLALALEHRLHREQLIELLWPEQEPEAATNGLHQALYSARRVLDALDPPCHLRFENEFLSLQPEIPLWVDVQAFKQAAKEAHRTQDLAAFQAALELYAGDLLPEDGYAEWCNRRREELRQENLALLLLLAQLYQARADYPLAIETYQKLLTHDMAQEEGHAGLMRIYAQTGQRQLALRQYQALRDALCRDLDVEPSAETQHLYAQILGEEITTVSKLAPLPAPPIPPHNLPSRMSSFVGREKEIGQVKQILGKARLATLTGSGGVGKTRLAIRVAEEILGQYPDGVWLVELSSLSDPELVPNAIAAVLEVSEEKEGALLARLQAYLCNKRMLLILDNCEHLVDACARLVEKLLSSCSRIQILTTSREVLGLEGEVPYRVPPLSIPDPHIQPSVETLDQFEAVRLFTARVQTAQPDFTITEELIPSITKICQRLDGIPLALELAATRAGVLNIEEIASRLDDRFWLLASGVRTALPRQRTLQASIEWSYSLLPEAERVLFRRLSVFAEGWTLEAAEAVCSDLPLQPSGILDLLVQLVNKSLVSVEHQQADETHYRFLDTLRQYAQDKLVEAGETEPLRHRLLAYSLHSAEENDP